MFCFADLRRFAFFDNDSEILYDYEYEYRDKFS